MSTIAIYQNYYADHQIKQLDPAFIPHNNANAPHPEQREYPVFLNHYTKQLHKQADLTGIMSWKFANKTGINGQKFIQFIQHNPGYDVYFINPFQKEERFLSVWQQGESHHPGIIELAQYVFDQLNYPVNLQEVATKTQTTAYCNFWVGTEKFWDRYIAYTLPVHEYIIHQAPNDIKTKFFERADKVTDSVYYPFVMERLFSTLITVDPTITYLKYVHDKKCLPYRIASKLRHLVFPQG